MSQKASNPVQRAGRNDSGEQPRFDIVDGPSGTPRLDDRFRRPGRLVGALQKIESRLSILLLTAGTLFASYLMFPDVGWSWLSYVCLVPWLVCVCTARRSRFLYFASWLLGLAYFLVNIRWMIPVTVPGYLALSVYASIFFPLVAWPIRHMYRRHGASVALVAPVAWVAAEYLRSITPLGFPWLLLGQAQYQNLAIIQVSDLAGVYGVSFILAMVNGWVTDLLIQPILISRTDRATRLPIGTVTTLVVLSASLIYGGAQASRRFFEPGPKVAVVQHDFPMYVDSERAQRTPYDSVFSGYLELARQAAGERPDLIVLPETAMQGYINEAFLSSSPGDLDEIIRRRFPPGTMRSDLARLQDWSRRVRDAFQKLSDDTGVPILIGSSSIEWKPTAIPSRVDAYNSAYLFEPARQQPTARYDKMHLVLFGEYVPFRFSYHRLYQWLNGITPWGQMGIEYTLCPGDHPTVFEFQSAARKDRAYRAAAPICYEELMPYIARRFVWPDNRDSDRKNIDMLLTISNDGWFLHSDELEQHLAAAVFRAVEHRIAIARSVNTGASAIVHPNGKVHSRVTLSKAKRDRLSAVETAMRQIADEAGGLDECLGDASRYSTAWKRIMSLILSELQPSLAAVGPEFAFLGDRLTGMARGCVSANPANRPNTLALADQVGDDLRTIERWRTRPDTAPGYCVSELKCDNRVTIYSRWGDWFAQGAVALFALMLIDWLWRRFRRSVPGAAAMDGATTAREG